MFVDDILSTRVYGVITTANNKMKVYEFLTSQRTRSQLGGWCSIAFIGKALNEQLQPREIKIIADSLLVDGLVQRQAWEHYRAYTTHELVRSDNVLVSTITPRVRAVYEACLQNYHDNKYNGRELHGCGTAEDILELVPEQYGNNITDALRTLSNYKLIEEKVTYKPSLNSSKMVTRSTEKIVTYHPIDSW